MSRPHIVIVGAGFGGVYTAKSLIPFVKKGLIDVTIINKTNYFLFTPLLHEVATGGLSGRSVTEPIRHIFSGTGIVFHQGTVESINSKERILVADGKTISYDYAVIATGAKTNFYGIPGAEEHSLVLKNLSDAVEIRERIIDALEDTSSIEDESQRKKDLSFVVVGGGATGVEMVSEMAEFIDTMYVNYFKDVSKIKKEDISIHLVNTGPDILSMIDKSLRDKALNRLKSLGIKLHMSMSVTEVTYDYVKFADGTHIDTHFVFWAGGITPAMITCSGFEPSFIGGKICTDKFMRMKGETSIFVLGDVACVETPDNKGYPALAQIASRQGDVIGFNIIALVESKSLKEFSYKMKGTLVSLGQWYAVGEIFGLKLSGRLMWWIWRTVYLFNFHSWTKRFKIAFEWTESLFTPRDITKLR
ncbi:MAG: NAD(P)/FAD-dependent oxidoreductase [Minisyncoccota bacterium]